MLELVFSLAVGGAIMVPVVGTVSSSMDTIRVLQNKSILDTAHEALNRYAARNNGCLPFAADWEGGMANTDQNGSIGSGTFMTSVNSSDTPTGKATARL